jgi:hypothetical protein
MIKLSRRERNGSARHLGLSYVWEIPGIYSGLTL